MFKVFDLLPQWAQELLRRWVWRPLLGLTKILTNGKQPSKAASKPKPKTTKKKSIEAKGEKKPSAKKPKSKPVAKVRWCPVCEKDTRFKKFGFVPRKHARCHHCHALERHRIVWLFFARRTNLFDGNPEALKPRLKQLGGSQSDDWNNVLANQTFNTLWVAHSNDETRPVDIGSLLCHLCGLDQFWARWQPRNGIGRYLDKGRCFRRCGRHLVTLRLCASEPVRTTSN